MSSSSPCEQGVPVSSSRTAGPAIYEFREELRLADVLEMAGGVTPRGYLRRVQVVRSRPSAEREVTDVDVTAWLLGRDPAGNPRLENGDFVLVQPSDPRIYNTVRVSGAVKYPGVYELKPGMRLIDILPLTGSLGEKVADAAEAFVWRDDSGARVRVELVRGRCERWQLERPPNVKNPAEAGFEGNE